MGIPAILFVGLELGLRLGGFGRSVRFLIPDERPGYFRTNPDFAAGYLPGTFDLRPLNFRLARVKPPGTYRIVVLGESAAQGIPEPAFAFAPQLRAQLRAAHPGKEIEVVDTGIVAINSHVVYQIAKELSGFSPDLFVVYMGNNEVVGPYGPGCAYLSQMPPLWLIRLSLFVKSTRTGQLLSALLGRFAARGASEPEWGGMAMFVDNAVAGDDPRLEAVYANFEANLRDTVGVAVGAGAKTLLCTVASNLGDCAPFLSLHRQGISAADLQAWSTLHNRGRIEWLLDEREAAQADLAKAQAIDPQYAETAYMLGSLELKGGDTEAARAQLVAAEHWDALRFRPDARINGVIRKVAASFPGSVSLLDAAMILGSDPHSQAAPAGRDLFFEHVHFDWKGNFLLARALAEGAQAALFGPAAVPGPWLDSAACAAALGYTPHERYSMLQRVAAIVENPPFPNQLTYCEDEARLARDLSQAKAERDDPTVLKEASALVAASSAKDPGNPFLARIQEDIDDDRGDVAGALEQAKRGRSLQPYSFALAADEAIKLSRLGRYAEAEPLLEATAASCTPRDLSAIAPAFADFYTRTGRFADGTHFLDHVIALRPSDEGPRLLRARMARLSGDPGSAERQYRSILAANPRSQAALEALVALCVASGRSPSADQVTLSAAPFQPRNLANNLRAAIIYDTKGDAPHAVQYLLAAEQSGPVTAAFELNLARKFFDLQRLDETLTHLAQARRISLYEGDPAMTRSIGQAIDRLWAQLH